MKTNREERTLKKQKLRHARKKSKCSMKYFQRDTAFINKMHKKISPKKKVNSFWKLKGTRYSAAMKKSKDNLGDDGANSPRKKEQKKKR